MLKKKNILQVIICFGCERLLLTYAEMDVYVHTALTGVRIDSEIFHSHGQRLSTQGSRESIHGSRVSLHAPRVSLQGPRVSLHGFRVSHHGSRVSCKASW